MAKPKTPYEKLMAGKSKKKKLGAGGRFAALEKSMGSDVEDPGAVAAAVGRKKYGKAKFQEMATKGRKRAK